MMNAFPVSSNIYKADFGSCTVYLHDYDRRVFLCAAFAEFLGTLSPPVGQWNNVIPLVVLCIV